MFESKDDSLRFLIAEPYAINLGLFRDVENEGALTTGEAVIVPQYAVRDGRKGWEVWGRLEVPLRMRRHDICMHPQ